MSDLLKCALAPSTVAAMANAAKGLGSGAGVGGLVGGASGALLGGNAKFRDARASGASIGESARAGLGGAGHGALRGVAIGALAGGAGGAAAPGLAQRLGKVPGLSGASHFGQRQVHSVTGVGDAAYVRSIGGGAADTKKRLVEATGALRDAPTGAARSKAMARVNDARHSFRASEKSEAMGLTSIPGYAKALYKNPREALTTGIKDQWNSMGPGGKALVYGVPTAAAGNELRKSEDSSGEGRGRFERTGRAFGATAVGMVAPLALTGDALAGGVLSSGMGRVGRLADRWGKQRRPAPAAPPQESTNGATQAAGYMTSDRAAGTAAESVTG